MVNKQDSYWMECTLDEEIDRKCVNMKGTPRRIPENETENKRTDGAVSECAGCG